MKVHVSLYGILARDFPGYQSTKGLDLSIEEGATAEDLLSHFGMSCHKGAAVSVGGRILKADATIPAGSHVKIFQTVHGG